MKLAKNNITDAYIFLAIPARENVPIKDIIHNHISRDPSWLDQAADILNESGIIVLEAVKTFRIEKSDIINAIINSIKAQLNEIAVIVAYLLTVVNAVIQGR